MHLRSCPSVYSRIAQTKRLRNSTDLFPTVIETGASGIMVPANLVSGVSVFCYTEATSCCLVPHMIAEGGKCSGISMIRVLIPLMGALPSRPDDYLKAVLVNIITLGVGF